MMTDLLQHTKLYEQVAERIKRQIVSGNLREGDRLPNERKLAERFGVSRTVIREAMKTLTQYGLVEIRTGQGTFVVNSTSKMLKQSLELMMGFGQDDRLVEVVEARELLEPGIAALAAMRATEGDIRTLEAAVEAMDHNLHVLNVFIEADNRFHLALAVSTHNHLMAHLLDPIVGLLNELRGHIFQVEGGPSRGQMHHRRILEAVKQREAAAARQAMEDHLRQVRRDTNKALEALLQQREGAVE